LRKEDDALVSGKGCYVDDLTRPGMVYLGVVRSPHAHARITEINKDAALAMPGVIGVYAAADLPEIRGPIPPYKMPRKFLPSDQQVLAIEMVYYVGEPVAVVVADDRRRLEDALELVEVTYEELTAVASIEAAARQSDFAREEWKTNTAYITKREVGDVERAMKTAAEVVEERFRHGRVAPMPMETRGVLAYQDETSGQLTVVSSTQSPYQVRESIAEVLGISAESIRAIAPDVGGGFGAKAQIYHEEMLVPALALRLKRPVKWIETRSEHFVATSHDREQEHSVRMGFDSDGKIVAIDDEFWADFGAYPVQEDGVTENTINHICSPYKVHHYRAKCHNVVTNKMFAAAYRGAGRAEGALAMDRSLDIAARRLGLDPAEIRRRNFIQPSEMPYKPGLIYKDGVSITYDPGDFPQAFERLLTMIGYTEARTRQQQQTHPTKFIGVGLSCYLHGTALPVYEGANVRVDPVSGKVYVQLGTNSQGQGHATSLAQICAEEMGVPMEQVVVVGADSQAMPYGIGAKASRTAAIAGPAVAHATREVRRKARLVAAEMFEASADDIEIVDGFVRVAGTDIKVPLAEVAKRAVRTRSLRSDPGLNAREFFAPPTVTWAFGAQAAVVEVDVETCEVKITKYAAVHDCGRPINPMIIEGQLHGAIVQGLGAALTEELRYDSSGQLTNGSFMDYAMPRASMVPPIQTETIDHRSMMNDLGIKGMAESGIISPGAVIANAVEDALVKYNIRVREIPVTPLRLFEMLQQAKANR
jgi:carbon-monoxide dehydrogenase large subunit